MVPSEVFADTPAKVELLLATYNSAAFLPNLLDSLLDQDFPDFQLIISDDGSDDATMHIIGNYCPRFARAPRLLEPRKRTGGAAGNFSHLLAHSTSQYVMLVDHDDIWHPNKVRSALDGIAAAEREYGDQTPLLWHGDLRVIDAAGAVVAPSFWTMKRIDPRCSSEFSRVLVHATVVGCTLIANRSLVKIALPVPQEAIMHDWWLNAIAAATGRVVHDPRPNIDYRIHGRNASAPERVSFGNFRRKADWRGVVHNKMQRRAAQAGALAQVLSECSPVDARTALRFADWDRMGWFEKRLFLLRNNVLYPGVLRNLALLLLA